MKNAMNNLTANYQKPLLVLAMCFICTMTANTILAFQNDRKLDESVKSDCPNEYYKTKTVPKVVINENLYDLGDEISVEALVGNSEIKVSEGSTGTKRITQYQICFYKGDVEVNRVTIYDSVLSKKEIEMIKEGLEKGQKVALDGMRYRMENGRTTCGLLWLI